MTMRANRCFRSRTLVAKQNIAITSDATTMSKPSFRCVSLVLPPIPTVISRSARSFMSITRLQVMLLMSIPRSLPW
jgi:hypothetical protein